MSEVGRNDPCPCGSGEKYKRCCLQRRRDEEFAARRRRHAPAKAIDWLGENYDDEFQRCIDEILEELDEERRARLALLFTEPPFDQMAVINLHEWTLIEGTTEGGDAFLDLVLSDDGPSLAQPERDYLELLALRPMGLYEVRESKPGDGLLLHDLLEREERRWVEERLGSESLRQGDVLGARMVPGNPWTLSSALYPFQRLRAADLLRRLRREPEQFPDPLEQRWIIGTWIRDAWFYHLTAPLPKVVDAGTGDPVLLTTDHYQVQDWDGLAAVLEAQEDVSGNREHGWSRHDGADLENRRSLVALNPGAGDRLELFARTLGLADGGRRWFEGIAGDLVRFRMREHTDPTAVMARARDGEEPPPELPSPLDNLSAEERAAFN